MLHQIIKYAHIIFTVRPISTLTRITPEWDFDKHLHYRVKTNELLTDIKYIVERKLGRTHPPFQIPSYAPLADTFQT